MSEYCKNCFELAEKLAEKEQEYKALLEQHKELDDRINRMIEEKYNLGRECEELKAYAQRQENQREEYYKEYLKLSQECEALKSESFTADSLITEQEEEIEELKSELHLYKTWYRAKHSDVKNTLGRYRKALEEIEGLVKNFCKDCGDYEDCNWEKEGCYYSLIPNLKDIINKAKGEGC